MFNDEQLDAVYYLSFLNNGSTIKFKPVVREHTGLYQCIIYLFNTTKIYSDKMKLLVLKEYETFSLKFKANNANEMYSMKIYLNENPNLNNTLLALGTGNEFAYKIINPSSSIYEGVYSFYFLDISDKTIVEKAYLSTVFLGQ